MFSHVSGISAGKFLDIGLTLYSNMFDVKPKFTPRLSTGYRELPGRIPFTVLGILLYVDPSYSLLLISFGEQHPQDGTEKPVFQNSHVKEKRGE
jgi:hypothetical protein